VFGRPDYAEAIRALRSSAAVAHETPVRSA
jgi:hypothetical protein